MLKTVKTYSSFNQRRYSNPWVAKVTQSGNIDFSKKIGKYTGCYKTGDAGDLYMVKGSKESKAEIRREFRYILDDPESVEELGKEDTDHDAE